MKRFLANVFGSLVYSLALLGFALLTILYAVVLFCWCPFPSRWCAG